MKNLLKVLGALTILAGTLAIGLGIGSTWNRPAMAPEGPRREAVTPPDETVTPPDKTVTPPGETVTREQVKDLPPPPEAVPDATRVRENLKEGKTYVMRTTGVLNMRATDKQWGLSTVCTVNFAFLAVIERTIEKNDGVVIQELRRFKEVKSLKFDTNLDSARFELGPSGGLVIGGASLYFSPGAGRWFTRAIRIVEGVELRALFNSLGAGQNIASRLAQNDPTARAFTAVGGLEGKTVRLVYRNDPDINRRGVLSLTPVDGDMTAEERAFHFSTSLLADSLIFPNEDVKIGDTWEVDGANFTGLIDPSLLAYANGKVTIQRGDDQLLTGRLGRYIQLKTIGGELTFHSAGSKEERLGYFKPSGELFFSPSDQIIVRGKLKGAGKLDVRSKDHLLFETRTNREPTMEIDYTCTIQDASGP